MTIAKQNDIFITLHKNHNHNATLNNLAKVDQQRLHDVFLSHVHHGPAPHVDSGGRLFDVVAVAQLRDQADWVDDGVLCKRLGDDCELVDR